MVLSKILGAFSADLGLDLGTTNTHVCVQGKGVVLSEPSVVAVKKGTKQVLLGGSAVGRKAKEMIGRTPLSIDAVNAIEKRAVFNAAERAGARKVYLIEEPRAAGLGAGIPIHEARAHMIVDIGGGTTDIAVLSLADVVVSSTLRIAGDAMDEAIVQHVKTNYNILIGPNTAEEIKIQVGSACPCGEETTFRVSGRDLIAGLPRQVTLTSEEVREALSGPIRQIVDGIRSALEKTGPELSGDLLEDGMTLSGGSVLLPGLPHVIQAETGLPVHVAEEPLLAVARGTAVFLERLDDFKHILESADDEL
jgi:rod shape-determining protein MreB